MRKFVFLVLSVINFAYMKTIEYIKEYSDLSELFYTDAYGVKHYAPFFTLDEVKPFFKSVMGLSFIDFYVAINFLMSNHHEKLFRLSSSEQLELLSKAVREWI